MISGDRVRLVPAVARTFTAKTRGKSKVDWLHRTGTVASITRTCVNVRWDDRVSLDQWSPQALRLVGDGKSCL
jgi:hypothetical protein